MIATRTLRRLAVARPSSTQSPLSLRWISSASGLPSKREEERRSLHTSPLRRADAAMPSATDGNAAMTSKSSSSLGDRFAVTAEVTVSKIFPAGFGWQTASIVADSAGFSDSSLQFALTTGLGDAFGVLAGHCLFYSLKKNLIRNSTINMTQEFQNGVLLGSAAFCSGTVWQPTVNALQAANLSFNGVFAGTWVACGAAFYAGLRLSRTLLHARLSHIEEATYENSKTDASLSVAIGGATAFFVGTDAVYKPAENFLIGAVGIADGTPDVVGCAIAGTSTSLGFVSAQSAMNLVYPSKKCWVD